MPMKCKYEIEYIYPSKISFEEMKNIICKKIAKIIFSNEDYQ